MLCLSYSGWAVREKGSWKVPPSASITAPSAPRSSVRSAQPGPDTQWCHRLNPGRAPSSSRPRLLLYCSKFYRYEFVLEVPFNGEGSSPGFKEGGREGEEKQGTHSKITTISSLLLFFLLTKPF